MGIKMMEKYQEWLINRRAGLVRESGHIEGELNLEIESIDSATHWLMLFLLSQKEHTLQ